MHLLLFLLFLTIFLLIALPKAKKINATRKNACPPGPPGLPIIGNMHQMSSSAPHIRLTQLSKKYGPLMSIRLASRTVVVVSSARLAKEVLKNHDIACCGRPSMICHQKISYNGLDIVFSSYNEHWRDMRKICILHLLSSKRVISFRPIREQECSHMVKNLSTLVSSVEPVNLGEIIVVLVISIIFRVAFGKSYENEGKGRSRFHELLDESQAMLVEFFFSDYFPLFGWIDKITGKISRLQKMFEELDSFYKELIDEHLNPMRPTETKEDILDILLQLREDNLASIHVSMDHIKATLMNIFLGASDTSSSTIIWAMTALIKNPVAMKKVQEEIRKMIRKKGIVDEEDIQRLPYLKAVVKETLRLYLPAPLLIPRETIENVIIDGYEIPPKTIIYINAWAIARDPSTWENPEEFLPERFLAQDIDYKGLDFSYIPFGSGRRGCPGIALAIATVELALANLLYSFDWKLPTGMKKEDVDTDVKPGISLHKKNDLCLLANLYV